MISIENENAETIEIQRLNDGTLLISIPKNEFVTIEVKNGGIPGITGPNIQFNIQQLLQKEIEEAKEIAFTNGKMFYFLGQKI